METERKFLDVNYIQSQLDRVEQLRNSDIISTRIRHSDSVGSDSIYIDFIIDGSKCWTIRISDHFRNAPHTNFMVNVEKPLTKKKKMQFIEIVKSTMQKALRRNLNMKLYVELQGGTK